MPSFAMGTASVAIVIASMVGSVDEVHAQPATSPGDEDRRPPPPAPIEDSSRVSSPPPPQRGWQAEWRRFGAWDYLGTVAVIGAFYAIETQDGPTHATWTQPVPGLDTPFRSWMVGRTRQARESAGEASDYLWYVSVGYPVVDVVIAAPLVHRDATMTYELSLMNLQAFSVVSLWSRTFHKTVGRARPNTRGCASEGPEYDAQCGKRFQFYSFPSGHAGVSMTGAGLSCAHHLHGHLYGNALADGAACATAVSVAATVGALRITADRHWMSDSLVGAGLGFATGYGLPTLLYYHPFWRSPRRRNVAGLAGKDGLLLTGVIAPLPGGWGTVLQGRF